jgi:hypothetical protein
MKKIILKIGVFSVLFSLLVINSKISDFEPHAASTTTRTINFSGYQWNVKSSEGELWGPGPNLFNNSIQNVYVDSNGSLHLKISYDICLDKWYCAEIYSMESFGYGTYNFTLAPGFESIDKNVVLGLFTYLDDQHEIDIEFAKWGQDTSENGQFVVQPSWKPNHKARFNFDSLGRISTHGFTWCPTNIDFWSVTESFNFEWRFYGTGIPKPSIEHAHMNLWLMQGLAPSDYNEVEVIIHSFEFIPSECLNSPIGIWWIIIIISILSIGVASFGMIRYIQKRKRKSSNF